MKRAALVAIDLGAESCRVSLLRWHRSEPNMKLVYRFPNGPLQQGGNLCWDIERIFQEITKGLLACAEIADEGIAAIGVDGWAVDYVRLDADGRILANPICYRDQRTVAAEKQVLDLISKDRLYELTGIQFLRFNTIYQLYADKLKGINSSWGWINLPEYITHRLGGRPVSEYTNSTHTQLVSLKSHNWCAEIFDRTGLDIHAAPPIVKSGSSVGHLTGSLSQLPAFRFTQLIVPACHDTASAIAGIPVEGQDWAFISSGTWSLVGTILDIPCANTRSFRQNFTNLGGPGGKTYFLKNINGMWLLQQCLESWKLEGNTETISHIVQQCTNLPAPNALLDLDDPELLLPGNMLEKLNIQLSHQDIRIQGVVEVANLILHSLANRYAEVIDDIRIATEKEIKTLYIVGGGSKNTLLNRLTSERTGLQVITGAAESSTVGNFAVQLATHDSDYREGEGVSYAAITKWARLLTPCYEQIQRI